jgi:hypothetical protein
MGRSVWFNASLATSSPRLRSQVQLITETMDLLAESLAGYAPLKGFVQRPAQHMLPEEGQQQEEQSHTVVPWWKALFVAPRV